MQSFDYVAPHLELAILSRKFRITEQLSTPNQVLLNIYTFFSAEMNSSLQNLHFHQVMDLMLKKTSNLLKLFNYQNNNP